jgi:hypothetical protein
MTCSSSRQLPVGYIVPWDIRKLAKYVKDKNGKLPVILKKINQHTDDINQIEDNMDALII